MQARAIRVAAGREMPLVSDNHRTRRTCLHRAGVYWSAITSPLAPPPGMSTELVCWAGQLI